MTSNKLAAIAILLLTASSPVLAQQVEGALTNVEQDTQPSQSEILAEQIRDAAVNFGGDVDRLREALATLPADMIGAEALFDEMIAEVEGVLLELGPDTTIAQGVSGLEAEATALREQWRTRCEETSDTRDCERVDLWDQRVRTALATTQRYQDLVTEVGNTVAALESEKLYVVDDIRLQLFDNVILLIGESLDSLENIRNDMGELSADVAVLDATREGN